MDLREKRHHADLRPLDLRPLLLVRGQLRCSADEEAKPRTKRKEVESSRRWWLSSPHLISGHHEIFLAAETTTRACPSRRHPFPFRPQPPSGAPVVSLDAADWEEERRRLIREEERRDWGGE
jgi:hypothetical protein